MLGSRKDADALITSTRTRCDRTLLAGSKVKFIGTVTIGFDHIDTAYCHEAGITWSNCPGCNAGAVEQYLHSSLLLLEQEKSIKLKDACLGIVGVGHVGSRIQQLAERLGMRVLLNDPPRADHGEKGFVDLRTLACECDIITFHTPLERSGKYQTYHLANESFFNQLEKKPYIINTSRGEVIETEAILNALAAGKNIWSYNRCGKMNRIVTLRLLDKVFIGTPHSWIFCRRKSLCYPNGTGDHLSFLRKRNEILYCSSRTTACTLRQQKNVRQLQMYNPHLDCEVLRTHPETFEQLRSEYHLRRISKRSITCG